MINAKYYSDNNMKMYVYDTSYRSKIGGNSRSNLKRNMAYDMWLFNKWPLLPPANSERDVVDFPWHFYLWSSFPCSIVKITCPLVRLQHLLGVNNASVAHRKTICVQMEKRVNLKFWENSNWSVYYVKRSVRTWILIAHSNFLVV